MVNIVNKLNNKKGDEFISAGMFFEIDEEVYIVCFVCLDPSSRGLYLMYCLNGGDVWCSKGHVSGTTVDELTTKYKAYNAKLLNVSTITFE